MRDLRDESMTQQEAKLNRSLMQALVAAALVAAVSGALAQKPIIYPAKG